ncbi:OprO/OprP family phosphate-selective porin [bacterium]|nr:OprO/OprP family phosphate-selective porin [bacterium]
MRIVVLVGLFSLACSSVSATIGPFETANRDSTAVLRLQLASQLQTYWETRDNGGGTQRESGLFMRARRIRPSLTLSLPERHLLFRLHLSTAPGAIELMDLYFDARLHNSFSVRAGQFKIPFTRYRIQSFQRLTFVDWSTVTRYFGAERQMGLALHNGYERPPRYAFVFGLFSGVNARASHGTGIALLHGEKIVNISDLSGSASNSEFHPELVLHLAYNSRGIDVGSDSDPDGGPLRVSIAASAACDMDAAMYEEPSVRVAQEFLFKCRGVSLMTAGYLSFMRKYDWYRTKLALSGFLIQTSIRVSQRVDIAARYAMVDVDDNVALMARSRAAAIIADTDDPDVSARYKSAGKVQREQEATIGCNYYLDGDNLKLQNDFGFLGTDRLDHDRTVFQVRSQLQLSF